MALHTFPTRAEGKLDIWEVDNADVQFSEWKYCCRCLPEPVWRSAYCVCLENEQKFLIFSNYLESLKYPSPKHIPVSILGQNSLQNSHGPVESTISGPGSSAENLQATRKPITPCPTTCQCDLALHGFCVNSSQGNLSAPVPNSTYPNLQEKLPQGLRRLSQPGKLQAQNTDGQSRRKRHPLRAKTVSILRTHEKAHIDYTDPAHMTASLSSLVEDDGTQPDRLFPGKPVDNYLSTLDHAVTALSRSEAYLPQLWSDPDRLSSSSRVRRFFQGLKRSFSFHQVGRYEPTNGDIRSNPCGLHQFCPAHLPSSDSWRAERRGTRLSRFFRCVTTTNTVHSPEDSKVVFSSRNHTKNAFELNRNLKMESVSSIQLSSCPGAFDPRASLFTEPDCLTTRQHLNRNTTRAISMDSLSTPSKIANSWTVQCLAFPPAGYSLSVPGLMQFGTVHPSLAGGREFCFFCVGPTIPTFWYDQASNVKRRDLSSVARIFAAQSELSRSRWIKSLRRTAKPNLQNERHRENSLRLSILEARNLPTKRRFLCMQQTSENSLYCLRLTLLSWF